MNENLKSIDLANEILMLNALLTTVLKSQAEILSRLDHKPDATEWSSKLIGYVQIALKDSYNSLVRK